MATHKFQTIRGWLWFHISRLAGKLQNYAEDQRTLYEGYYKRDTGTWRTTGSYWATYTETY